MKTGILLGVVVVLVLLSQAGIGFLAFKLESKEAALAELRQHEMGNVEKLRVLAAQMEVELERLQPEKTSLEAKVASLRKQLEEVVEELEERSVKVSQLRAEEQRLAGISDESLKSTRELASLEVAATVAQEGLDAKQKEAGLLEAKVQRLMNDYERLTKDSAFIETADTVGKSMSERLLKLQATLSEQEEAARASATKAAEARVILERASGDLETLEAQKSAVEEEILVRRRELATLDGEVSSKKETKEARGTSDKELDAPE